MNYKGFITSNIEEKNGKYSAIVENSRDYLKIESDELKEIQSVFEKTIDNYIKKCEDIGVDPLISL